MNRNKALHRSALTLLLALCPATAFAGAAGEVPDAVLPADEALLSVEIPLEGPLRVTGAELLRVSELLDERTEFAAGDFRLDELVLVARSEAASAGEAELLVMDWRSGEFDIPPADEDEWFEVRIPAPETDPGGAWLLDVVGDVTVDMLVAVLEPRPAAAATHTAAPTRTVYRLVDGHRTRVVTRWVHSPHYYHVYHYHHGWPYRYFRGAWRYDLVYRPRHTHYRYHHRDRHARHHYRDVHKRHRKLRRIHPRVRVFTPRERRAHQTAQGHPGKRLRPRSRIDHPHHRAEDRRDPRPQRRSNGHRGESRQTVTATAHTRTAPDVRSRRGNVARPTPTTRRAARPSRATAAQTPARAPRGMRQPAAPRTATRGFTPPSPRSTGVVRNNARDRVAPPSTRTAGVARNSVRDRTDRVVRQRQASAPARSTEPSVRARPSRAAPPRREVARVQAARPAVAPRPVRQTAPPPRQRTRPAPARTESAPSARPAPQAEQADAPRTRRPGRGDRPERR